MKPKIAEINVETGESAVRELTKAELEIYNKDLANWQTQETIRIQNEAEQNAMKESALQKLAGLGLTEAEIKALVG